MKKYLFYTLALVGCWLLPLGVQILVSTFDEKYVYTWGFMGNICLLCVLLFQSYRIITCFFIVPMEKRIVLCALWVTFLRDITAFPLSPFENFTYMG